VRANEGRLRPWVSKGHFLCSHLAGSSSVAYAWVVPNGSASPVFGVSPFADPAAAGDGFNGIQFFSTNSGNLLIPTEPWAPVGSIYAGQPNDALQAQPLGTTAIAAPTVAKIGNQYVMWFVGYQAALGQGAKLYVADSPAVNGLYVVRNSLSNPDNPAFGLFDPTLHYDVYSGNWWLIWTVENGTMTNNNQIVSAPLTSDGENMIGPSNTLLTYNFVDAGMRDASGIQPGPNPQIENPDLITDPQGTYVNNLTFSYGTYNEPNRYRTGNAACDGVAGPCGYNSSEMQNFDNLTRGNNTSIQNSGGASFVHSGPQSEEAFMPFAAAPNNNVELRNLYQDQTNSGILSPGEVLVAGGVNQGLHYCLCDPNAYQLRIQTDGNLVIYNDRNVPIWASNTSGDANSFAVMQGDGNFVVYDNGQPQFATRTDNNPGAFLAFQNSDGNLVVYSSSHQALWASGT